MLIIAWIFMTVGIVTTIALLSDLKEDMRYNVKDGIDAVHISYVEGEHNGLQKTGDRKYRELLCRCG